MTMRPTDPLRATSKVLRHIYEETLSRVAPGRLLRDALEAGRLGVPDSTAGVLSVGKCAVPLASAFLEHTACRRVLAIAPEGYVTDPDAGFEVVTGSHPGLSEKSRVAARRAISFVRESNGPVLFLVSGGASACMEDALEPHVSFDALMRLNTLLLESGLPIEEINTVRRHLSSVKGGRLGTLARRGSVTLVYSDVPPGREDLVGSGPTLGDPTTLDDAAGILELLDDPVCNDLSNRMRRREIPETAPVSPTRWGVIADSDDMVASAIDIM